MSAGAPIWAWRLFVGGAVLGALVAITRLPYFSSTAAAQMLALVGQSPEWSRAAAYGGPAPRLARALAAAPGDVVLHLGALSWEHAVAELAAIEEPGWCGSSYRHETFQQQVLQFWNREMRSALVRPEDLIRDRARREALGHRLRREQAQLEALSRRFPHGASLRAYHLFHLLSGPVWIPRAEAITPAPRSSAIPSFTPGVPPDAFGPSPTGDSGAESGKGGAAAVPPLPPMPPDPPRLRPTPQLLERFDAIARAGQRLEPENGFFAAMRAVAAFAGEHDAAGMHYLHAAAAKPIWNDHSTDEQRAVWKLLRAAYGDRGAEQVLPSREWVGHRCGILRPMARVVVWHAAAFERAGAHARAQRIRGDLLRLGLRLQDRSPHVIGQLIGDDIFYLAMAPATSRAVARNSARRDSERKQRLDRYTGYLAAHGGAAEVAWVRYESERGNAIQQRLRRAQNRLWDNPSYWPPRGYATWWEWGVILLQQIVVLLFLWGGVRLLALGVDRQKSGGGDPRVGTWVAAHVVFFGATTGISLAFREALIPFWTEYAIAGALLTAILGVVCWEGMRRRRRAGHALPAHPQGGRGDALRMALASLVFPILPVLWFLGFVSHVTAGGSSFGLLWWGLPLGFTSPELAFLPALMLCWLGLCRGAALGLSVGAAFCRGVRSVAPYTIALLILCYLGSTVLASSANVQVTRQMELMLTDELAVMEAAR